MNNFFKFFFASLLALVIFSVICFLFLMGFVSGLMTPEKEETGSKAVLVLDLNEHYQEVVSVNPLSSFSIQSDAPPSLYDVVRMIHSAKADSSVKGIYIKCGSNQNGFAASDEIRNALIEFKKGGKFIYAYGDVITQKAYHVGNVADKIYCNPKGGVDWRGFAMQLLFLKGTLEKLDIQPQIFYAGKFKSATEPFREYKMTEPNRVQNTELLNDLYGYFLHSTSTQRKIDTATLHRYANESLIQFAEDALRYKLVDGLKYDDEVREEIRKRLRIDKYDKINFITLKKYARATDFHQKGRDKIAVIYAEGDIIDGRGERSQIGSENYGSLIRKARLDKTIKALVFRVNSGGGSALASENLWRELTLTRKEKPVVISFGDVAASGGYYLACGADSIFAQANTITGSIGVFSLLPNMQEFFNGKLGVTFDGVKTAPDADIYSVTKPLTEMQKRFIQNGVDSIYSDFKTRVAEGRKLSFDFVDSIGQGRIWSGMRAIEIGLVDRIGGLHDAIASAAILAKTDSYKLREYPEPEGLFDMIFEKKDQSVKRTIIKEELGDDGLKTYSAISKIKQMLGITQARVPFEFSIE